MNNRLDGTAPDTTTSAGDGSTASTQTPESETTTTPPIVGVIQGATGPDGGDAPDLSNPKIHVSS